MNSAIIVLKQKQRELVDLMVDQNSTNTQKLAYTLMHEDLSEAIKILDRAFFTRNVPNAHTEGGSLT